MTDHGEDGAPVDPIQCDVLVIGGGMAGSITALEAARGGAEVVLIQRGGDPTQSNTHWAQGGIVYTAPDDSPELLAKDILGAGAGLCHPPAVDLVTRNGPRLVKQILIDELEIDFDRTESGELDVTEEAAHSLRRIIHSSDRTGEAITARLANAVAQQARIRLMNHAIAIDLLTLSHHSLDPLDIYPPPTCAGAYVFLSNHGIVRTILARETVLASGGLGQLFLHTTNPSAARGSGIAMAYRAGARLLNLEFIQFHPTALYHKTAPRFLISEAVRGEGGRLILLDGLEFMDRYDPRGSLAARDIVARAIHTEMLASHEPCVYLDLSHKDEDWIRNRFPKIHGVCLKLGIDITREPMPVVPAAHYSCGGVAVDLQSRTSITGLRAVGEVACTGMHGANRLASTSLLEALVFGYFAGRDIVQSLKERPVGPMVRIKPWSEEKEKIDPALILQDWLTIKYTMWNYVGLARTEKRLRRARNILRELQAEVERFYARARLNDDIIGLRDGVQAALAVLYAAIENRASQGCHYRNE